MKNEGLYLDVRRRLSFFIDSGALLEAMWLSSQVASCCTATRR